MNLKDDKSNAPLESYYTVPKSSFKELLDMSEWGVIGKIIFYLQIPLALVYIALVVFDAIGVVFNRFIDGAIMICAWLIVVLHVWLFRKKTKPDGKPTPKRWYVVIIVGYSIIGMYRTVLWLVEHL